MGTPAEPHGACPGQRTRCTVRLALESRDTLPACFPLLLRKAAFIQTYVKTSKGWQMAVSQATGLPNSVRESQ